MIVETTTTTTIQNCPFCGAEAVAKSNSDSTGTTLYGEYYWVKCTNKACSVSPAASPTLDAAIETWNRRA
jgi:Lar family restriction alleviation protein